MLPSHILSPLGRILGLIVMSLGLICMQRPNHFPMDWMLQIIWFLGGLSLAILGFIILIYTPWISDREWRQCFKSDT